MSRGMDWLTKVKCIQYNIGNESNCLLVNLLLPQYHLWLSILLSQLTNTRVFYLGGKLFILIWFFKDELIMKYNLPAVSKEKPESSEQKVCYS